MVWARSTENVAGSEDGDVALQEVRGVEDESSEELKRVSSINEHSGQEAADTIHIEQPGAISHESKPSSLLGVEKDQGTSQHVGLLFSVLSCVCLDKFLLSQSMAFGIPAFSGLGYGCILCWVSSSERDEKERNHKGIIRNRESVAFILQSCFGPRTR